MRNLIIAILIVFAGFTSQAQEKKDKNAKQQIAVKGNCGQCKARIEKAAFGVKGVKLASWDEQTQNLKVIIDETKCSTTDVSAAVAKSGHDTEAVKATDEDYAELHHCCKYERD